LTEGDKDVNKVADVQARPIWRRAWDRLRDRYCRTFRHGHHVYLFDPAAPPPPRLDDFHLRLLPPGKTLPSEIADATLRHLGPPALDGDLMEIRAGGVLWTGVLGDAVVGSTFTRGGAEFARWLLPLEPEDRVIFRLRTLPPYQGRGIGTALLRAVALQEWVKGGNVYVDCAVFHAASVRTFEKAGFRRVATVKSLSREEALGSSN
jgi:GNAT superfamily N-acetyltransferase